MQEAKIALTTDVDDIPAEIGSFLASAKHRVSNLQDLIHRSMNDCYDVANHGNDIRPAMIQLENALLENQKLGSRINDCLAILQGYYNAKNPQPQQEQAPDFSEMAAQAAQMGGTNE